MKKELKIIFIENKRVGRNTPVFIIAEAGVNHNGKLDLALRLVDEAAKAGADAVKFQTFKAEQVVTEKGEMAAYQEKNLRVKESQRDMLHKLELPENFYPAIIERCKKRGIIFLSTPHGGEPSVDLLESLNISAYKIGSGDLTNYLILKKVARIGKPIFLSTGMATLNEVKDAVTFIKSQGNDKLIVFHCTTSYPCFPKEVNMAAMQMMMKEIPTWIGYSDHTLGTTAAKLAAALSVKAYECHFTLDKTLPGPDHVASASPKELKARVQAIRQIESKHSEQTLKEILNQPEGRKMWGKVQKQPTENEKLSMIVTVRKSLVLTRAMKIGEKISRNDITAKRPGNGTSPVEFQKFLGRKLAKNKKVDEQLCLTDLVAS